MRWLTAIGILIGGCAGDASGGLDAPASDAPPGKDPCSVCGADQLCVQRVDGMCTVLTVCVTTTDRCAPNTCSATCEQAHCPRPYQCADRPPCGTESPTAFTCYGP